MSGGGIGGWELSVSLPAISLVTVQVQLPNSVTYADSKENGQSDDEPVVHIGVPSPAAGEEERGTQGNQLESQSPWGLGQDEAHVHEAKQSAGCTQPQIHEEPCKGSPHPATYPNPQYMVTSRATHAFPPSSRTSANSQMHAQLHIQNNRLFTPMFIKPIREAPWTTRPEILIILPCHDRFREWTLETDSYAKLLLTPRILPDRQ